MVSLRNIVYEKKIEGIVSASSEGKLWIVASKECEEQPSCNKTGCMGCGGVARRQKIFVETSNAQLYPVGTEVVVKTSEINQALAAIIIFGIPLILALSVLAVWYALNSSGTESVFFIFFAGIAFFSGFIVVGFIDRIFRKKYPSSIISSKP